LSNNNSDCFMAGHKVITNRGISNIEDIKVGDMVLSHDLTYNRVYKVDNHIHNGNVLTITLKDVEEAIVCTPNHKFLTYEAGWVEAQYITFNHHVLLANRREDDVDGYKELVSVSASNDVVEVMYNLCVEKSESYTVNGVVVHGNETNE